MSPAAINFSLLALVACAFYPVWHNGFINFDDPFYVTDNRHVQNGLTWGNVRWAFTTLDGGFWHPLTWLSYLADFQLFGLNPRGFHLTNLLLHAMNSVLLFLALQRLTAAKWRSAAVAALFALHPLHVETVAWIADRKDSLAAFFCLLALLAYVRYAQTTKERSPTRVYNYYASLGLFLCALMSKATIAPLPLIFLLLDWWPLARCERDPRQWHMRTLRRLVLEKLPFLIAAFIICLAGVSGQRGLGAMAEVEVFPITDRVQNAVLSYGYYLAQTFWPVNLAGYYPYPQTFSPWLVASFAITGLVISILILRQWRKWPYLAVGWIWYGLTLLPVIGLMQVGGHSQADRFTYLPLVGIFILLVWGTCDLAKPWRQKGIFLPAILSAVLMACMVLTHRQIGYWRDSETFWNHTLALTKNNALAEYNLGVEMGKQGRMEEADFHLQQALRLKPDYADAHNALGAVFGQQKRFDEAVGQLAEAIRLRPDNAEAHGNLADALFLKGDSPGASEEYHTAIKLKPEEPDFHLKLARLLSSLGQFNDAIPQFNEAIRLAPRLADAHCGLGMVFLKLARTEDATIELQTAVKLDPNSAEARCNLGVALCQGGRLDEGIIQLQEAVRLKPDYSDANVNLEVAQRLKSSAPH